MSDIYLWIRCGEIKNFLVLHQRPVSDRNENDEEKKKIHKNLYPVCCVTGDQDHRIDFKVKKKIEG